jgi:acetoacetate decarboxylase
MLCKTAIKGAVALSLQVFLLVPCLTQASDWGNLSSYGLSYPTPPLRYEGNQVVALTFKTSPEILRELVPVPLTPAEESLVTLYVANLNIVEPEHIAYYEAALLIPASYGGARGSYVPVLYLDRTLPITIGREIWGFPKFEAEISMTSSDGVIRANVMRGGQILIDVTLELGDPVTPGPAHTETYLLRKTIPSVGGGGAYDVDRLVTAHTLAAKWTKVVPGQAELRLGSSPSDPLNRIPVGDIVSAAYIEGSSVLDYGEVLHDYLSEADPASSPGGTGRPTEAVRAAGAAQVSPQAARLGALLGSWVSDNGGFECERFGATAMVCRSHWGTKTGETGQSLYVNRWDADKQVVRTECFYDSGEATSGFTWMEGNTWTSVTEGPLGNLNKVVWTVTDEAAEYSLFRSTRGGPWEKIVTKSFRRAED